MTVKEQIREYIITNHAPDLAGEEIPGDYDLLANGVIDSLALLELVEWVQEKWDINVADVELAPADFQSIDAIEQFIQNLSAGATVVAN